MPTTARRAKIVATLGPASRDERMVRKLIRAGLDVARLNFSHGTAAEHADTAALVRRIAREEGRTVAILLDLQGPKLRVGQIAGTLTLKRGTEITLTTRAVKTASASRSAGDGSGAASARERAVSIPVTYRSLPRDVQKGDAILLDDGIIQLRVLRTTATDVVCRVLEGGSLTSHKGINIPGRKLSTPALTPKDRRDLSAGVKMGVDYVALSFVREAADIESLRRALRRHKADIPVIAKLEKPQAVENLDAIIEQADGIMVARGDLGVELPPEDVPILQKRMIQAARRAGKPVITATQMLESMIHHPRPTRAEASDVANAIFDGTDAVMLSAETAVGAYPEEAVRMMARIIEHAEASAAYRSLPSPVAAGTSQTVPEAVAEAASSAASELSAAAIAVFTQSGSTARVVAKFRPITPIYAFTPFESVRRRLALVWGIRPRCVELLPDTDEMVEAVANRLLHEGAVRRGDLLVVTAGTPVQRPGSTNFLKVHRVG
jgi:pyruvate kinase